MGKEQQVIEELLAMVQSDRFPVGSALPSERKLAAAFHTSRNTLRNAIRSLEARGLLQVRRGSGCYLLAKEDLYGPLRAAEELTRKALEDLFEARYVFEPVVGACATRRIDGSCLKRLEACVVRLSQAIIAGDTAQIIAGDIQFRDEIAAATENFVFRLTQGQLRPTLKVCGEVFAFLKEPERDVAFADCVEILNSMKIGEAEQTADLLRRNILRLCDFVVRYTDTSMPPLISDAIRRRWPRPVPAEARPDFAGQASGPRRPGLNPND